jgi:hypothetical protein
VTGNFATTPAGLSLIFQLSIGWEANESEEHVSSNIKCEESKPYVKNGENLCLLCFSVKKIKEPVVS